jgi:hypothetical protein
LLILVVQYRASGELDEQSTVQGAGFIGLPPAFSDSPADDSP